MAEKREFSNYDEFFAFYVQQHSHPVNRVLHACGTTLGLLVLIVTLGMGWYWWALLWIPVAYSFAWFGHLVVEGNKPASWGHPFWSFISDFRMLALMLTGRLRPWLDRDQV
jgi:hypothetical protein